MPSIVRYQPVSDDYTTYHLLTPASNDMEALRATVLATLDGYTYVSLPDGMKLPSQPKQITVEPVTMTDELKEELSRVSQHVALINERVRTAIADRYSISDEIKMLRTAPSQEFDAYNAYAEDCRAWGRTEKAKLGL